MLKNTPTDWGGISKTIHWIIAICIFAAMITAILNNQLLADDPWQRNLATQLMNVHRSCGTTALTLGVFRLVWALLGQRPSLPDHMNEFDRRASSLSHRLIYGLALAVPLTGWLTTAAFGTRFEWFGLFTVFNLIEENRDIVPYFYHAHWILYHLLLVVVILHVGAALWHHYSQRDEVLTRMLPGRSKTPPASHD